MGLNAREEMDMLLDALLRFAQQMLEKHGEFHPFAAALDSAGELQLVAADSGEEQLDSSEVIELLYEGLTRQAVAGEIRAGGVCVDVRVTPPDSSEKTDAISVAIEHANSDPVEVFLPYATRRFGGARYGALFAQAGTQRLFAE
jgi:hypothetical protein